MSAPAEAIHELYPFVSVERAEDLLAEAAAMLGPRATPIDSALYVTMTLGLLWGFPGAGDEPVGILR